MRQVFARGSGASWGKWVSPCGPGAKKGLCFLGAGGVVLGPGACNVTGLGVVVIDFEAVMDFRTAQVLKSNSGLPQSHGLRLIRLIQGQNEL